MAVLAAEAAQKHSNNQQYAVSNCRGTPAVSFSAVGLVSAQHQSPGSLRPHSRCHPQSLHLVALLQQPMSCGRYEVPCCC